ncbi:uncharacterized protein LOC136037771 [Artemia franciscana]
MDEIDVVGIIITLANGNHLAIKSLYNPFGSKDVQSVSGSELLYKSLSGNNQPVATKQEERRQFSLINGLGKDLRNICQALDNQQLVQAVDLASANAIQLNDGTEGAVHEPGRPELLKTNLKSFSTIFAGPNQEEEKPHHSHLFFAAVAFCLFNGFIQGFYLVNYCKYEDYWLSDLRFVLGLFLFFSGLIISIHSDHVLKNLRKPGETSYKIPNKGLFHSVTRANYFGEILEWSGFAIASWSPTAAVFALFAALFLGQGSLHHHKYEHWFIKANFIFIFFQILGYLEKFEDYPKDRNIVIPFVL